MATGKRIEISLARRKLIAYQGDSVFLQCDCVTGRPGKDTAAGKFKVEWKANNYRSKTYDAPMPYSLFFHDGQAIHGSSYATVRSYAQWSGLESISPQPFGSHGCVGIYENYAKKLYPWAHVGVPIVITK